MSSVESKVDDLEEGEIEEDAFEDISDCSLTEAIVPQKDLEHDSDVELLRKEALESLQEDDEVPEEELYRLEALKSLLTNMESSDKISPAEEIRKKKRRHKKRKRREKATKCESSEVSKAVNDCEKSKLLVETSEERSSTSQVDNPSSNMDFSDKENQTDCDMNLVTRSWYPKTDFALLNLCSKELSSETKQQPRKSYENDDFIIVPRVLSVANNDTKSTNETVLSRQPVNRSVKFNRVQMPVNRAPVPVTKLNSPVGSATVHLSRYKKVIKQPIQKYPLTQPSNRFSLRNVRKGKYKIVNKSCYSLKKTVNSPTKTVKQNTQSKSVYSLNRVQKPPSSSKPSQFIIELDEDESGKEDDGNSIPAEKPNSNVPLSEIRTSDELPCRELPNWISSSILQKDLLEESVAEISSEVEKESNIESFETSLTETVNEVSVDMPNDEDKPCLEVTASTALMTTCYDSFSENNQHILLPGTSCEKMNDETEVSEMIPDAVHECPTISSRTNSEENKFEATNAEITKMIPDEVEEYGVTSLNVFSQEEISLNQTDVSKITSDVVEECDVNFLAPSICLGGSEQLMEEPAVLDTVASPAAEFNMHVVVKEEPIDYEPVENLSMEISTECDVANEAEIDDCENSMVLQDAENDLIEIRARLLLNLDELEESMKKDESEREKLNTMLRKLLILKSSIFKFENKIRAHQSKLSIHADTMQALLKEFVDRTDTCARMKNVCFCIGMEIMGPQYKPPDLYENVIEEKIHAIDFSKYMPNSK